MSLNNNICLMCQDESLNITTFTFECGCWCKICDSNECVSSTKNIVCIYKCAKSQIKNNPIYNQTNDQAYNQAYEQVSLTEQHTSLDFFDEAPIYEKY